MKKTLKALVAVMLAAAMLAACGAKTGDDASAEIGNKLTVSDSDNKETAENSSEDKENSSEENDENKENSSNGDIFESEITVINPKAGVFDVYDVETGEHLLHFTRADMRTQGADPDNYGFVRQEYGLLVLYAETNFEGEEKVNRTKIYVDKNGKIVRNPAKKLPEDIDNDYPVIKNGIYISTDENDSFQGLKSENGDVIADNIYTSIVPNDDYTYFNYYLNQKEGVMDAQGNMFIKGIDGYNTKLECIFLDSLIVFDTNQNPLIYSYDGKAINEDKYTESVIFNNGNVGIYNSDQRIIQVFDSNGDLVNTFDYTVTTDELKTQYDFSEGFDEGSYSRTKGAPPVSGGIAMDYTEYYKDDQTSYINFFDSELKPIIPNNISAIGTSNYVCYYSKDYKALYARDASLQNNYRTYIFGKDNKLLNSVEKKLLLRNNSLLEDVNTGEFYDVNLNLVFTSSDTSFNHQNYDGGDIVFFRDNDLSLWGVVDGNKVVIEPKFTSIGFEDDGLIHASRGSTEVVMNRKLVEFQIPEEE